LTTALTDTDRNIRAHAALALGKIGKPAAATVPALLRLLGDRTEADKVRVNAAWALAQIGPVTAAEEGLPTILDVIGDARNPIPVRERAVWALRVHSARFRDIPAIPQTLTGLLAEPKTREKRMLRYDAAYMLGMVWGPTAPAG